ncbi:MAG: helix-turn-helix transcriptional regulator [Rubrivivax sp.]|nr:helix-turn-helix transcriptional regulator [Rubrivivax sp.]
MGSEEQKFGRVLHRLRRQRGLAQDDFAFKCGMSASAISKIERGLKSPKLDTIFRIAKALDIQPAELIAAVQLEIAADPRSY